MLIIHIISDDKPGHLNQSKGLAEAIGRVVPVAIEIVSIGDGPFWKRISRAKLVSERLKKADVLIAAGHKTHLPLLALGRNRKVPAVVLMKPSLPPACFDLCLVPQHDLKSSSPAANVIPTIGALNRVVGDGVKENIGLILLGGASKYYAWNPEPLQAAIACLVRESPLIWHITDSRRTAADFLTSLADLPATLHPHAQTSSNWLPEMLGRARQVWVTEDSISMIYEAITSRAAVGLLPMKALAVGGKLLESLDQLISAGYLTPYQQGIQNSQLTIPNQPLAEADRCARLVMEKLQLLPK